LSDTPIGQTVRQLGIATRKTTPPDTQDKRHKTGYLYFAPLATLVERANETALPGINSPIRFQAHDSAKTHDDATLLEAFAKEGYVPVSNEAYQYSRQALRAIVPWVLMPNEVTHSLRGLAHRLANGIATEKDLRYHLTNEDAVRLFWDDVDRAINGFTVFHMIKRGLSYYGSGLSGLSDIPEAQLAVGIRRKIHGDLT
jgi:hypothetical protein